MTNSDAHHEKMELLALVWFSGLCTGGFAMAVIEAIVRTRGIAATLTAWGL